MKDREVTFPSTPILNLMFEDWKRRLPRKELERLAVGTMDLIEAAMTDIKEHPGPPELLAAEAAEVVDVKMAESKAKYKGPPVQCKAGCGACCHLQVWINEPEAKLLALLVRERGVEIDMDLLREQATYRGTDAAWFKLPKSRNRCVFLGPDQRCRIYENRPVNCRKLLMVSPPANCKHDYITDQPKQVLAVRDLEVEAFASAFGGVHPTRPMPELLLKELS